MQKEEEYHERDADFFPPHKWVDDGMVAMQSRAVVGRTAGVCHRGLLCFAGLLAVLGLVLGLAMLAPWWGGGRSTPRSQRPQP